MLWAGQAVPYRRGLAFLRTTDDENLTIRRVPGAGGISRYFIAALPLRRSGRPCVWSAGREVALVYPARYLFRFLDHHGLLRVGGSPRVDSVAGGSPGLYVERLAGLLPDARAAHAVSDVTRREDGVEIRRPPGRSPAWTAWSSTHADQALGLLADPAEAEVTTLKAFGYSSNVTVLHTDSSVLPEARNACAWRRGTPDYVLRRARPARRGELLDEPAPGAPVAGGLPRHASPAIASTRGILVVAVSTWTSTDLDTAGAVRAGGDRRRDRPHRLRRPTTAGASTKTVSPGVAAARTSGRPGERRRRASRPQGTRCRPPPCRREVTHRRPGWSAMLSGIGSTSGSFDGTTPAVQPCHLRAFACFSSADHPATGGCRSSATSRTWRCTASGWVQTRDGVMLANARVLYVDLLRSSCFVSTAS